MSSSQNERPDNYYEAYIIENSEHRAPEFKAEKDSQNKNDGTAKRSIMSVIVQILFGALLVIIGIPMLILPGPGLLTIIAGVLIVANGIRNIFRPTARTGA